MAELIRRPFMPWQRDVADVTGEVLPDGRMAYPVVVLIVPRRAGKTALTLARQLQKCAAEPMTRAWYCAQTGSDAGITFRDDWMPLVSTSKISSRVRIRQSNGSQSLTLPNASRIGLFSPTETALHGQDADDVVCDEAWAHDLIKGNLLEAAVRPTMATRRRRQLWIISAGGTVDSEWLLDWRTRGRATIGADQGLAYFEWYPECTLDPDTAEWKITVDLDDPATWADTHPAVGFTIDLATLVDDRKTMTAPLFYRSYLDLFTDSDVERIFAEKDWLACQQADYSIDRGPGLSLGYAVARDRHAGAVVMSRRVGERIAGELVEYRDTGIDWMAPRIAELKRTWRAELVADSVGPATTVTRELADLGLIAHQLDTRQYLDACAELYDDVIHHRLLMRPQPHLDAAAAGVARAEVGDGFRWNQKRSAADASPIVAYTVAAHRARHHTATAPRILTAAS